MVKSADMMRMETIGILEQKETLVNTDNQFIARLQTGDEQAFAHLYDAYAALMFGVLNRIVQDSNEAESLLQECFIKIWQNVTRYDAQKGRLATWLINIARNTAIDFKRSKHYSQKSKNNDADVITLDRAGYVAAVFTEDGIGLEQHVKQLSSSARQVIELMYFEGYTQQEISEEFGIPLGTVKTRIRAGIQELRKYYL